MKVTLEKVMPLNNECIMHVERIDVNSLDSVCVEGTDMDDIVLLYIDSRKSSMQIERERHFALSKEAAKMLADNLNEILGRDDNCEPD